MTSNCRGALASDPVPPDWANMELETTWADELRLNRPGGLYRFFRSLLSCPKQVQLDRSHPLIRTIPKYALQEFHNLPNGNYSRRISRGYITGFDKAMLGCMTQQRKIMAESVGDARAVLDIGTGGGKLAWALHQAGAEEVWGVDVSPYLLQHAAQDYPQVQFYQACAESLPFSNQRFDAVTACFLFHEMPPKYIRQALSEVKRVLRPGGRLLVAEPSARQLAPVCWKRLWQKQAWRHIYFKVMALRMHEPFINAWHELDKQALFYEAGFDLESHSDAIPINYYSLKKRPSAHGGVVG
ncbi:class I SAM-dependent methyltransferase [Gilvimarinus chinensis]|uniref:class I SAM-dependent methyltransferase n=1 Tax=Gilvimarinus chinensis TaxID=396005 RepID=UPI0014614FD7|nr:class I SAM-dependent methyltransferase [Gilvimarinus chinensis]